MVEPYSDQLTCYASTAAEWPLNKLPAMVSVAINELQDAINAAPAPQPAQSDAEPLQAFVSPRAKTLMQAFEEGWRSCADSEYIGKEAQNDAFNQSRTVNHCIAEDMLFTQPAQHPDDEAVDKFAAAMKQKLALAREKGRGGWEICPPEELSRMLREHVEKGDPRDVANFCMFLWSLGHGIAQ